MILPEVRGLLVALAHWRTATDAYHTARTPESIDRWRVFVADAEEEVSESFRRAVRAVKEEGG